MNPIHPATVPATTAELPPVPLTLEGYATLHQMMRFRWTAWRALPEKDRREITSEAAKLLAAMEAKTDGQSALFSLLGHKGDLMLVHFRESFDQMLERLDEALGQPFGGFTLRRGEPEPIGPTHS